MHKKLSYIFVFFTALLYSELINCQYYMYGGYNYAAIDLSGGNSVVNRFNQNENHSIPSLSYAFHGYQLGFGKYSANTIMEIGFGNLISNQSSNNTNQLKERAEVVVNYMAAHFRLGYKPFPKEYFTFGAAVKLGNQRYRYSFGGDYLNPVNEFQIGAEFYVDYGIKLRFLLKKSMRSDYYYLLRIRPYYQIMRNIGIGSFDEQLNSTPNVNKNAIEDNFSHFGFNISLVIPFISEDDRLFLEAPKKKRKKKKKKNKKPAPRGRL